MFSGIVEKKVRILATHESPGGRSVRIEKPTAWRLQKGASVAVDGICSTVRIAASKYFEVEYMPETLSCTTAGDFRRGRMVNLERSLRYGAPIDGHFVQGHVDGVAEVVKTAKRAKAHEVTVHISRELQKFVAHKGSITLNGVALTVARIKGSECTVALIPYTLAHTNLAALKKGDTINVETDLLARYLAKLREK